MNKKLLALFVSSAFLFAACGDDDSPSSPENQEEISSSSEDSCESDECDVKSSSSKKADSKSSSSKANDKKPSDSKDSKSSSSVAKDEPKSSSSKGKSESSSSKGKPESSSSKDKPESSSSIDKPESSSSKGKPESSSSKGKPESSSSKGKPESSSSIDKPESSSSKEEPKSSSSKGKPESSSSKNEPESSSSKNEPESSSSVDSLNVERAATLEDLYKNMEINGFGSKIFLSIGSKLGVFSLRIPDELWIVTYSDFENGEVEFKEGSIGVLYSDTDAAKNIVGKTKEGIKISFKVEQDTVVKYAVNDSDYTEIVNTKVSLQSGKVSKAEKIMNKTYTCTDDNTTKVFSFYDKSYFLANIAEGDTVSMEKGYYDIHRSTLLLYNTNHASLSTYSINEDKTIDSMDGKKMNCTVDEITEEP